MLPLKERKKFNQKKNGTSSGKSPKKIHSGKSECSGSYPVSSYVRASGVHVSGYTRSCFVHEGSMLRSYMGKAVIDMSDSEIDELLEDYI